MRSKSNFTVLLLLVMLAGNMVIGQVKSEYDKSTDFTKYKTFTFKGWQKNSDKQLDDIDKNLIEQAFKTELNSRGLTSDEDNAATNGLHCLPDGVVMLIMNNPSTRHQVWH